MITRSALARDRSTGFSLCMRAQQFVQTTVTQRSSNGRPKIASVASKLHQYLAKQNAIRGLKQE